MPFIPMRTAIALLLSVLLLATASAGCLQSFSSNKSPTVAMSVTPTGTVFVGDLLTFSAVGSSDPDGDALTYNWDFGDGNTGTGLQVTHSYTSAGTFDAELRVSDGDYEQTETIEIVVAPVGAMMPTADITHYKDDDCMGEEPAAGTHILVWLCEEDLETNDDTVDMTATVSLDASGSTAGDSASYLVDYEWDIDIYTDSDSDGDLANDVDLTGETVDWTNVPPGEYKISLTVRDNNGFVDTDELLVYVNYRGVWAEFTIDANQTTAAKMTFGYPVVYDQEQKNTIRYVRVKVTYPIEDDDWVAPGGSLQENRLDLYGYNHTDEEVGNTSAVGDDDQVYGDCDDDDRCLWMQVSTSQFRNFLSGDWTVDLVNSKHHDTLVKEFAIELIYK